MLAGQALFVVRGMCRRRTSAVENEELNLLVLFPRARARPGSRVPGQ